MGCISLRPRPERPLLWAMHCRGLPLALLQPQCSLKDDESVGPMRHVHTDLCSPFRPHWVPRMPLIPSHFQRHIGVSSGPILLDGGPFPWCELPQARGRSQGVAVCMGCGRSWGVRAGVSTEPSRGRDVAEKPASCMTTQSKTPRNPRILNVSLASPFERYHCPIAR